MIRSLETFKNSNFPVEGSLTPTPITQLAGFPDIFQIVLSNLQPKDIQATAFVNRQWNKISISTAQNILNLNRNFACFLGNHLPQEYPTQRERLLAIGNKVIICDNLLSAKSSIDKLKEGVIIVLQEFGKEDIKKIEELVKHVVKPYFFEHIFDLVKIYRKMKEVNYDSILSRKDEDQEGVAMWCNLFDDIGNDLTSDINCEKVMEIIYSMPEKKYHSIAHYELAEHLQMKNEEMALKLAKSIPDKVLRTSALSDLSENLDDPEIALEAASLLHDTGGYSSSLETVVMKFVRAGEIQRAIEIADSIPDINLRSLVHKNIALTLCIKDNALSLAEHGDVEEAKEKIRTMPDWSGRIFAVRAIAYSALKAIAYSSARDKIEKVKQFAEAVLEEWEVSCVLKDTSIALLEDGQDKLAKQVALIIPRQKYREEALQEIKAISDDTMMSIDDIMMSL